MYILENVAANALGAQIRISFTDVAIGTPHFGMCADQRKFCAAVIERLYGAPARFAVAIVAFLAEATLVTVSLLVAIETFGRCFAKLDRRQVAFIATCRCMSALELKIGKGVIEGFLVQRSDVGVVPKMVAMTMIAVDLYRFGLTAVKPSVLPPVGSDFLVAVEA